MKKFCNKITKQQWRVTVPNINSNIFRRSPFKDDVERNVLTSKSPKRTSSGSYDVQAAERAYNNVRNGIPSSALGMESTDEDDDDSSDEGEEHFEDARATTNNNKSCVAPEAVPETSETEMYVDVDGELPLEKTLIPNGKYEVDVPKISFCFFEGEEYSTVDAKKHKAEIKINLEYPESELQFDGCSTADGAEGATYANEVMLKEELAPKYIETEFDAFDDEVIQEVVEDRVRETKLIDLYMTKSLQELASHFKCGSDPNISLRPILEEEEDADDDGLYKVPKPMKRHRLSQSLNDFTVEPVRLPATNSAENVSGGQTTKRCEIRAGDEPQNLESLDYCKARSKLPVKIRRLTLLKKPKNKAADTWANLKLKVNSMILERSNVSSDKEKFSENIEEMYRSSRDKCKWMFKQTGKMFRGRKEQDGIEITEQNGDNSSQIIKNDAFFDRIKSAEENSGDVADSCNGDGDGDGGDVGDKKRLLAPQHVEGKVSANGRKDEFDFQTPRSALRRSKDKPLEGQNGFDDLRRYVKHGGDFCKELASILQERSDAEIQYAKNLSKLSGKLARACRDGVGGLNEAWRAVAAELEARAEGHRLLGAAILEDAAKPLRTLNENQQRTRKHSEAAVDKATRNLSDWRAAEAKSKKHSHACARENEKLQDAALDNRLSRSTSLIHLAHIHKVSSDKESAKVSFQLEGKKRKAENAVKKADIEYYTLCVRAERARLEWESAVVRGATTFQSLEEDRLSNLKSILLSYLNHSNDLGPKLTEATNRLTAPVKEAEPAQDLSTFVSLRQSSQQVSEQLLPDFYCEHITLAMNRERRKQALVKLVHLIKQDIERERKSKNGLENLSRAIKQTPNFGAEESNQSVAEKLYHVSMLTSSEMKSMLTYLEGARYKIQNALGELDNRPKMGHPLGPHISITRDKSGLQQSILKVPQWLKEQWCDAEKSPVGEKSEKSDHYPELPEPDWTDRGTADGNSNQPDSDFDEFSSQGSSAGGLCTEESPVKPVAHCKALYAYTPNLSDELPLHPGDILAVYRQQEDGWWLGECNGSVGIFPATYVETLPPNILKC